MSLLGIIQAYHPSIIPNPYTLSSSPSLFSFVFLRDIEAIALTKGNMLFFHSWKLIPSLSSCSRWWSYFHKRHRFVESPSFIPITRSSKLASSSLNRIIENIFFIFASYKRSPIIFFYVFQRWRSPLHICAPISKPHRNSMSQSIEHLFYISLPYWWIPILLLYLRSSMTSSLT